MQLIILKCFRSCGFLNGGNGWFYGAQLLFHNQLICFCLTGLAVYHTNETHFPHWLSWRRLPLRRQRDWHCAEGSGTDGLDSQNQPLRFCDRCGFIHLFCMCCFQVQVEKIRTPEDHIGAVLERAKAEYIQKTYRIPSWSSAEDFLEKLAFRTGKLLKVWPDCGVSDKMNCQLGPRGTFVYSFL